MYTYRCTVLKVIDGDTVDVDVDLGFDIHLKARFRLYGIDAPEMKTPEGKASREYLILMMPVGDEFLVNTKKDRKEKFGRYLGTFFTGEGSPINELIVEAGHAVKKDY